MENIKENKIYFIYAQKGKKSNISTIETNEQIKKIDIIKEGTQSDNIYILYCLTILNTNKEKPITLTLKDNKGELYISNIYLNNTDIFQYKILFEPYYNKNENSLDQIILPNEKQFEIFKNSVKNDMNILYNLYSSRLTSFLMDNTLTIDFDFLWKFFIEFYQQFKNSVQLESLIIKFFNNFDLKTINNNQQNKEIESSQYNLDILSDPDKIRNNLITITKNIEEINEKIDVFLGYHYYFHELNLFTVFINKKNQSNNDDNYNNNDIVSHLISNRTFFDNFSLEKNDNMRNLLYDSSDLTQTVYLMKLLPNMVETFNILQDEFFYIKLISLSQIERKVLNIMILNKPQKNDNIKLISEHFEKYYKNFLTERSLPVMLTEDFFIQYSNLFLNEDLNKINIIINILKEYNSKLSDKFKVKMEDKLNNYYIETGFYLINQQKLINKDLIDFLKTLNNNKIDIEKISNGIKLNGNDKEFINNFLNNSFDNFDLKVFFGYRYYGFMKKIFDNFILPKDLLVIMDWKISNHVNEEVVGVFLDAIKRIWLNDPENHMYGLEELIANEFAKASLLVKDYINYISDIENKISKDKILVIYSKIFSNNYNLSSLFKKHIIDYIDINKGSGPLAVWYMYITLEGYRRFNFLIDNIKDEYAVQTEDFIHYPSKINDRIVLFTNLYNSKSFNDYWYKSNYYIQSIKSKDNIQSLKYKDVVIIHKNIMHFATILYFFFPNKNLEERQFVIDTFLIDFSDKCELAEKHYNSLKTVLNFLNRFYPKEKYKERIDLKKLINEYENTPLNNYIYIYNKTVSYLDFLIEAKESENLFESIFFMEIYEQNKNIINERDRYTNSFKKFNDLKILGKYSDINMLDKSLIDILVLATYKNYDKLNDELDFIKSFFNFNSDDNKEYNNFVFKMIKRNIVNLVLKYQDKHGEYKINPDDYNEDEDNKIKEGIKDDNQFTLLGGNEEDDEFCLFSGETKGNENNINKNIENGNNQIVQQKMKLLNEISDLSDKYFSNVNKFIDQKYNMNKNNNNYLDTKSIMESFIQFFIKLFKTNQGFSRLSNKEFFDNIISLSNKIFVNGTNLGLFDKFDQSSYKNGLIIISQFIDVIETFTIQRKISKGIIFKLLKKFMDCYEKRQNPAEIIESTDNLFSEMKEIIQNVKLVNLLIELLIKEKRKLENNQVLLIEFILRDGVSDFNVLYKDLIPIMDEFFKNEIAQKFENGYKIDNKDYTIFSSPYFNKINKKCKDLKDFEEMMLYYFETKIINILNKKFNKKNNNEIEITQNDQMRSFLNQYLEYLEKEYKNQLYAKSNKNISILFCIAFIKCYMSEYIRILTSYSHNNKDNMNIINIIKGTGGNDFRTVIKLYFLKLIFENKGNYYNYSQEDITKKYQMDCKNEKDLESILSENQEESNFKNYGFDFMIIPMKEKNIKDFIYISKELIKIKKTENNDIDDKNLLQCINNNYDIDTFFCAILNIHFSFFYNLGYLNGNSYKIIDGWLDQKLNKKDIKFLDSNKNIKTILLFFIKDITRNNNERFSYNQILCLSISARYVLNTLSMSNQKDGLYYNLITNVKDITSKYPNYFKYYLKDLNTYRKEQREINYLTYKIINYIILSHLYFGQILRNITLEDINKLLSIELKEEEGNKKSINYIRDLLFKEFDFIINEILKIIGINKNIIFMNSIFEEVSSKISNIKCSIDEQNIKLEEQYIDSEINKGITDFESHSKKYYNLINQIVEVKSNIFTDIIFEKNEFYNKNQKKFPFISYLTSTNFCTFEDFKNQFLFFINGNDIYNYPLINCILNNDDIIELINYIPTINLFINHIYNELVLKISKNDIKKKIKEVFSDKTLEKINEFNDALEKSLKIIGEKNIKKIDIESEISEIINLQNNTINNLYNAIIKKYNKFISNIKIYKNNKDFIEPVIIQNALENDYITFKITQKKNNNNNNDDIIITIYDRLLELIQIYSKRERLNKDLINVYDGGKIIYNFELIENKLEKEFIYGKKIFEENQKLFIFSNEVYSGERNKILLELIDKYEQEEINNKEMEIITTKILDITGEEDLFNIYCYLQYLIIFLMRKEKNNNYDSKTTRLDSIVKKIIISNYYNNKSFTDFIDQCNDIIYLNHILFLYGEIELKVFDNIIKKIDINISQIDMKTDEEIKQKIENILTKEDILINKDVLINSVKRYILRYCIGNNNNEYEILDNFKDLNNIFNQKDIWDKKILNDNNRFRNECDKLIKINNEGNCLIQYCSNIIFDKIEPKIREYGIDLEGVGVDVDEDEEFF